MTLPIMMQHWIFVLLPFSDFNRGDIAHTLCKAQNTGRWPIGRNTVNRFKILKGDQILFYLAGDGGKKFTGSAALSSNLIIDECNQNEYVQLENIYFWKKPLPIRELIKELTFIKNKEHWGLNFQGGLIRITESDYSLILKKAKCRIPKKE